MKMEQVYINICDDKNVTGYSKICKGTWLVCLGHDKFRLWF